MQTSRNMKQAVCRILIKKPKFPGGLQIEYKIQQQTQKRRVTEKYILSEKLNYFFALLGSYEKVIFIGFMFSLQTFLSKNKAISLGTYAICAISHDLQTQSKQQC